MTQYQQYQSFVESIETGKQLNEQNHAKDILKLIVELQQAQPDWLNNTLFNKTSNFEIEDCLCIIQHLFLNQSMAEYYYNSHPACLIQYLSNSTHLINSVAIKFTKTKFIQRILRFENVSRGIELNSCFAAKAQPFINQIQLVFDKYEQCQNILQNRLFSDTDLEYLFEQQPLLRLSIPFSRSFAALKFYFNFNTSLFLFYVEQHTQAFGDEKLSEILRAAGPIGALSSKNDANSERVERLQHYLRMQTYARPIIDLNDAATIKIFELLLVPPKKLEEFKQINDIVQRQFEMLKFHTLGAPLEYYVLRRWSLIFLKEDFRTNPNKLISKSTKKLEDLSTPSNKAKAMMSSVIGKTGTDLYSAIIPLLVNECKNYTTLEEALLDARDDVLITEADNQDESQQYRQAIPPQKLNISKQIMQAYRFNSKFEE